MHLRSDSVYHWSWLSNLRVHGGSWLVSACGALAANIGDSLRAVSVVVLLRSLGASHILLRTTHISLNKSKDLLNKLNGVGSLKEGRVDGGSCLSLHVQEVSPVLCISLNLLADLRKLIICDLDVLAINDLIVKA